MNENAGRNLEAIGSMKHFSKRTVAIESYYVAKKKAIDRRVIRSENAEGISGVINDNLRGIAFQKYQASKRIAPSVPCHNMLSKEINSSHVWLAMRVRNSDKLAQSPPARNSLRRAETLASSASPFVGMPVSFYSQSEMKYSHVIPEYIRKR